MNYLKSFEGFKSSIATAGIIGALSMSPKISKSNNNSSVEISHEDDIRKIEKNILNIPKINKENCKDSVLLGLLQEIEISMSSDSLDKYKHIFEKLSTHLNNNYQFKIEEKDVSSLNISDIKNMDLALLLGWIGSLCLAICALPQAWQSFKEKNSNGISWGFLMLWGSENYLEWRMS